MAPSIFTKGLLLALQGIFVARTVAAQDLTPDKWPQSTCGRCSLNGGVIDVVKWTTVTSGGMSYFGVKSATSTATIVKTVHVANGMATKTETRTVLPADYTPPPTDKRSAYVETIEYGAGDGATTTVVLTFPNMTLLYPKAPMIVYQTSYPGALKMSTDVPLRGLPQPPSPPSAEFMSYEYGADPATLTGSAALGWGFHLVLDVSSHWILSTLPDLGKDLPVNVSQCKDNDSGPNWGGFPTTSWMYESSTTTVVGG